MTRLINRLICLFRGHIYYDCICGRCGKHLFDAPIKKFFKRIECLFRGHEWKLRWRNEYEGKCLIQSYPSIKCARCGKTKEERV